MQRHTSKRHTHSLAGSGLRRAASLFAQEEQRGQMLVLLAMAMVALLVASGLAVDTGVLLMRKAQLDRAVDAAALAGVVELSQSNLTDANTRGQQIMAGNGITTTNPDPNNCTSLVPPRDYCGAQQAGQIPGSIRYRVEARWQAEVYFMPLLGFSTIPLRSVAIAEYLPQVDIYASDINEVGIVKISNQSIFGPAQGIGNGDPYTPVNQHGINDPTPPNPNYPDIYGAYTYRVRIPGSYTHDDVRVEIFEPDTGNTVATLPNPIYGVDGSTNNPANPPNNNACQNGGNDQRNTCLLTTPWGGGGTNPNPVWFVRVDEERVPPACCDNLSGGAGTTSLTQTLFRLYYLKQQADGSLVEVDLAYYIGDAARGSVTDMMWVSPGVADANERMPAFTGVFAALNTLSQAESGTPYPVPSPDLASPAEPALTTQNCESYRAAHYGSYSSGAYTQALSCSGNGDFIVDIGGLDSEVPGIYVDPVSGVRDIYLQVRGLAGASENGFEFWAGPPRSADPARYTIPAQINARHVYILASQIIDPQDGVPDELRYHQSEGVSVFGLGHLPMNSNTGLTTVDIPLAYLGPEFSGQQLTIQMFDPDAGAVDPIIFYFDTIPISDWALCYDDNGTSSWSTCPAQGFARAGPANIPTSNGTWNSFSFVLPSDATGQPFYGGRLIARYQSGRDDTYGWKIELESRPYLVH